MLVTPYNTIQSLHYIILSLYDSIVIQWFNHFCIAIIVICCDVVKTMQTMASVYL